MTRRLLFAVLLGGFSIFGLVKSCHRLRRPAYESHVTGDAAAKAGLAKVEEGRCVEAIPILESAERKPMLEVSRGQLYSALGGCYLATPESSGDARRARGFFYQGLADLEREAYDDARGNFTRTLELRPDDVEALENLGSVSLLQGRNAEAIEELERAIGLDGSAVVPHSNLALAYAYLGRFADAEREVVETERRGYKKGARLRERIAQLRPESAAARQRTEPSR